MKFYIRMCTAFGTVALTALIVGVVFQVQFTISGGACYALVGATAIYAALTGRRGSGAPQLPQATAVQLPPGDNAARVPGGNDDA